jgi:hypothetical protein
MEEEERGTNRKEKGESRALGKSFPAQAPLPPLRYFTNLADNFNKLIINRLQNDPYHNVKILNLRPGEWRRSLFEN